jgi:hypothetical protein
MPRGFRWKDASPRLLTAIVGFAMAMARRPLFAHCAHRRGSWHSRQLAGDRGIIMGMFEYVVVLTGVVIGSP